jgi:hypothetical protein
MELAFLHGVIKDTIKKYHLHPGLRYVNICFSSKNIKVLDEVCTAVRITLPTYQVWSHPDTDFTPTHVVRKKVYLEEVNNNSCDRGLIIHKPEQWFVNWSLLDKQAFWSERALNHNSSKTIILFADSNEFRRLNINYYKEVQLPGVDISLWLPARAES